MQDRVLLENERTFCIADGYPMKPAHRLAIPLRHGADWLMLHQPEWNPLVVKLLQQRPQQLNASGEASRQSVFHVHWHLSLRCGGREDCVLTD